MNDPLKLLLNIKSLGLGVNQAAAILCIGEAGTVRVSEVAGRIDCGMTLTSQLFTRLYEMRLVYPVLKGRVKYYRMTPKGVRFYRYIMNQYDHQKEGSEDESEDTRDHYKEWRESEDIKDLEEEEK